MRAPYLVVSFVTIVIGVWINVYHVPEHDPRVLPSRAVNESIRYSNILPNDYVGPETCAKCHQDQYQLWKEHPHHCMNQLPNADTVMGDFDDVLLTLPTGEIRFTTDDDGKYWMTITKHSELHRKYVVTRTVGSRFMQFYIGKQTFGPDPKGHDIYGEHMLPFAYWFKIEQWYPRQYFDPAGPEQLNEGIPQVEAVDRNPLIRKYTAICMNCHNTLPYVYRIYERSFVGFPSATVAGAIEPLGQALSERFDSVGTSCKDFGELNGQLDPDHDLVTLGISCESCHFGGREHAIEKKMIRFLPTSKYTQISPLNEKFRLTSDSRNALTVNGICTQCHSGGDQLYPNSAGKVNSREGLDFHAGFCATEMRCIDCHEPHTATNAPAGAPDLPAHVDSCIRCHDQYRDPENALTHSGHPASAGVNCLDCHMPRYTQGLDELVRTHRICMPVEESMISQGLANACNVCHVENSQRWTLNELERGWGKRIEPTQAWPSYAHLDKPAGEVWLNGEDFHMRLVATQCYARSKFGTRKLPALVRAMNDPAPINRVFATFAFKRVLRLPINAQLEVDITAAPAIRQQQIDAWLEKNYVEDY